LTQQYLTYRFYEKFPNCLILLKDKKSNSIKDLQQISGEEQMSYILNFPKISFYKQNNQTYCKLQVQLYDQKTNKLLIDNEYTGDWNNPGFEFSCQQGTMGCGISNAMSFAMPDIIKQIALNSTTLIQEKQIAEQRAVYINSTIYKQPFNATLIKSIININDIYQCLFNSDQTKFVAFFIKTIDTNSVKSLLTNPSDQNVKIITSKDIRDTSYFNQHPQTYAYIVKGVKYNSKWYYEKSEVTYFNADNITEGKIEYLNNLQGWNFFKSYTAQPDTNFWNGKLFTKIQDKRKDPNWEKNKDIWESEEREDRDYIGLYEIVADKMKAENAAFDSTFRSQFVTTNLVPFYNKQIKSRLNHIVGLVDRTGYYSLVYPKDKHIILNPIEVIDEKGIYSIRYFVFIPKTNEVYEWTLVKPNILKQGEYTDDPINKTIGALTEWNFSHDTLDDNTFWDEKVLGKDTNGFKYLKRLE